MTTPLIQASMDGKQTEVEKLVAEGRKKKEKMEKKGKKRRKRSHPRLF
jgi:hypothetical protein